MARYRKWLPALRWGMALLGLICLGVLFDHVGLAECAHVLSQLSPEMLLFPLAIFVLAALARSLRWQMFFPVDARPSLRSCFAVFNVATAANTFVPARGGDLLRVVLLSRLEPRQNGAVLLVTILLEKIADGLTVVLVLVLAGAWLTPMRSLTGLTWAAALLFVLPLLGAWLLRHRATWLRRCMERICRKAHCPGVGRFVDRLLCGAERGLSILGSWRHCLGIAVFSLAIWAADAVAGWYLAQSVHILLPWYAMAVVYGVVGLSLMIPAGPAGIGTYEAVGVATLGLFGVATEQALPLTLLLHGWGLMVNLGMGLVCLPALRARTQAIPPLLAQPIHPMPNNQAGWEDALPAGRTEP